MRTRGFPKDAIIDGLFNIAKGFKENYYWKDARKHKSLTKKLTELERVIEQRRELVK